MVWSAIGVACGALGLFSRDRTMRIVSAVCLAINLLALALDVGLAIAEQTGATR